MSEHQGFASVLLHRVHALLTTILLYILSLGPMPRHVGFVMDGNRRYAKTKGMRVSQGHTDGFHSLRRVSRSLENLTIRLTVDPRSLPEAAHTGGVDIRLRDRQLLAGRERGRGVDDARSDEASGTVSAWVGRVKGEWSSLDHRDLLQEYGVRVRFVGRTEMLPEHVKKAIVEMEQMTAENRGWVRVSA